MPSLIVTGGSRGIGAACARAAAAAGWAVCVNYRESRARADAVVAAIEADGGTALAVGGDVADEADVVALFDRAEAALGPVGGLINNAGSLGAPLPLAETDLARWNATLATNLTGSFLCAREAVRRMAVSRGGAGGAIVNVSSMGAVLGSPGEFVDYAAAKGGVDTLTIGLAKEVAADGIRVNAVRPGLIDTEIHGAGRVERLIGTVPLRRVGTPDEVAQAVLWLLSPAASYCTGVIVNVSGGR